MESETKIMKKKFLIRNFFWYLHESGDDEKKIRNEKYENKIKEIREKKVN